MNYAGPIMGSVCILSWIWYKFYWVSGPEDERQSHKLLVQLILSQHHNYFGPGNVSEASGIKSETGSSGRIDKEKDSIERADTSMVDAES